MPSSDRWWGGFFRFEAAYSLFAGSGMLGGLLTYVASIQENAPKLTSVGWLLLFLGVTILVIIATGAAGWAWHRWLKGGKISQPDSTEGHADAADATPSPVNVTIVGAWSGYPFRRVPQKQGSGVEIGTVGEDVVIRVDVRRALRASNTIVRILDFRGSELARFDPPELAGDMAPGKVEEVTIGSIHFMPLTATLVDSGPLTMRGEHVAYRLNLRVLAFDGTSAARRLEMNHTYTVSVTVTAINLDTPYTVSFDWDVRESPMPVGRIRNASGIEIDVGRGKAMPGESYWG